jgi:osmotically inducible protein OsmC
MPTRTADAEWKGNLQQGKGHLKVQTGTLDADYDFRSRFADGKSTNPEELIAAAHAGCFSMALSGVLGTAGFTPERIHTTARVHIEKQGDGFAISKIELDLEAKVPGINEADFKKHADAAKQGCPVSKALAATPITLTAKLL